MVEEFLRNCIIVVSDHTCIGDSCHNMLNSTRDNLTILSFLCEELGTIFRNREVVSLTINALSTLDTWFYKLPLAVYNFNISCVSCTQNRLLNTIFEVCTLKIVSKCIRTVDSYVHTLLLLTSLILVVKPEIRDGFAREFNFRLSLDRLRSRRYSKVKNCVWIVTLDNLKSSRK